MKTTAKATWYIATICAYVVGFSLPCYAANDSTKTNFPATASKQYVAGTVIPIAIQNGDFSTLTTECPAQADLHCPDMNNNYPLSANEASAMQKFGANYHSPNWVPYSTPDCPPVCYVRRVLQVTTANNGTSTYPPSAAYPAPSPAGPNNPITNITVTHPAICPAGYVAEAMYNPDWDIEQIPSPQALPYPIPDFQTLDNYVMNGYSCTLVASTASFQATTCFQHDASNNKLAHYTYYPAFVGRAIPFAGNCPSSPSTLNDYYNYVYCNYNNTDSVAYANASTVVLNLAAVYQSAYNYQVFANNGVGMFTNIGAQFYDAGYDPTRGSCYNHSGNGNSGATDVANKNNPCYLTYSQNYDAIDAFTNFSVNVICQNWTPFAAIAKPIFSYYQCTKPAGTQFADYKIPTYVACARVTPIWHVKGQPYLNREPATPVLLPVSPAQ